MIEIEGVGAIDEVTANLVRGIDQFIKESNN